jgi:hypothetical protein
LNYNNIEELYARPQQDTQFWRGIDQISDTVITTVGDVLLDARVLTGNDYVQVASIIHQYKTSKSWTTKQRRSVAMLIITHWRDIDWRLE